MLAGIRDILVITTPTEKSAFVRLLGDGSEFGLRIQYAVQPSPGGLAQAFLVGEEFVDNKHVALALGDNIFYGHGFKLMLERAASRSEGATIFGYPVINPRHYGVVEFDSDGRVISVEEKPKNPKSDFAIPGLYFYDSCVVEMARDLRPSKRGELEITDLNRAYLERGLLHVEQLSRGFAWLDAGTHDTLLDAGNFVATLEKRQGFKICCIEEIAFRMGFIDRAQLANLATQFPNEYGDYLRRLLADDRGIASLQSGD
jgi:glucose-1-phosphate thymidylyltransferase